MEHLNMKTPDGAQLNLDALYQICPSCFTEGQDAEGNLSRKVNWNKLRELLGEHAEENAPESYDFTWVGKRAAQREAAAPINKTLRPCPEESVDWENTQNLYIEGDNLEVLKLLQNSYMGKVKMIYIDPPYNTGNDFVYHDDFATSFDEFDRPNINEGGQRYYTRNTESNGQFHSVWCSMMYARLMVARSLLKDDGVVFISIDDNEAENLKKIGSEIFGESNFVAQLIWERAYSPKNDARFVSNSHDYVLMYAKNIDRFEIGRLPRTEEANARYTNRDNDPRGVWKPGDISVKTYNKSSDYQITTPSGKVVSPPAGGCWRFSKETFVKLVEDNRIWFGANNDSVPQIKRFLSELKKEGMAATSILFYKDVGHSQDGAKELQALFDGNGVFDGPKPTGLIKHLIRLANTKDKDIVLDFFSGSGTTAHTVFIDNFENNNNNRFILVQLSETGNEKSAKLGFDTLCEIGKERIRRAGAKIKAENPNVDTGFRVFKCDSSNMKDVYFSPSEYSQDLLAQMEDNIKEDRTDLDLLFDCMLRWGVELSLPLSQQKVGECTIHNVNDGDLVACFDGKISEEVIDAIAALSPLRVVFRDSSFAEASEKMNLFELFKQKCQWSEQEVKNNVRVI